ncbi:MAG TPA: DUF3443 family protein [Terriglobia bacterium]|nr:DUF3443 family protein [Terriglobia bacterium]
MRLKNVSAATLACLLVVMAGGMFLTSCTKGSSNNEIPFPVITLSPVSASVPAGGVVQFNATVVSPTSTTITWSVNNILGGNSMVGTVNSSGLYTAPASVPNPAVVTVKAISSAESNPSGSAIVTITAPAVNATVTVAPTDSWALAGATVQFAATVTGTANTAVAWSVDGVAGGNSTAGTISAAGLYTAPTTIPGSPTIVVTATSQADTTQSASTTLTLTAGNTAPLFVNFGPNGNSGNPGSAFYNGLFTTVTVCLPVTGDCQIIPDVLVDTGSVGLRILNSQLTTVPATELTTVLDSAGNQVQECVQFGNTSYAWGPVLVADVVIGGEKASSVPIQVIGDTTYTVPAASCLSLGPGPSLDTVAALGANGILGVGTSIQDCGLNCAGGQTFSAYPYYVCPKNECQITALPVAQQVTNPVALFAKDNNGVEILLPSISPAGAPSLPYTTADGTGLVPAGLLVFGVGTESNNALGSATLYAADGNGNFPTIAYNGNSYTSDGFLDTGSNALYVSDAQTLGILNCTDNPYYCPTTPLALSLTIYGANSTSGTVTLNVANADTLFDTNPSFAAFNNLGGDSSNGLSSDYFDLGLPFFFGRSVFVGIAGTTVPNNVSAPNGYFAF